MFHNARLRASLVTCAIVACLSGLYASAANAAAYNLDPVTTGITEQITATLPVILPVAGGLIALFVAWRLIKRMTSA